jgi:cytochrome c biogenesis protein CcmG/thiol:disulfide interchange protein DsbE
MSVVTDQRSERRPRLALWAAGCVGLALLLLIGVLATRQPAAATLARSPLLGQPAPALSGQALDGSSFDSSRQRGRFVVVNFFNSWCVPCKKEHPQLLEFAARHKDAKDAVLVGVIRDDDPDAVRSFRQREGGDWPALDDPSGRIGLDFGVRGQPETFVIDRDGVVVARYISEVTADALDGLLAKLEAPR